MLKHIIDEIDENVNTFIKTHQYFDVLGALYIEFLRYANSDKGLGIVLTPPYKAHKKTDTDELEFVLNNLECLVDGGTCVAIVPMQSALVTNGKGAVLKKELLKKHTLEAVLSMPDELFFNSDVGEVTCIMIFTPISHIRRIKRLFSVTIGNL